MHTYKQVTTDEEMALLIYLSSAVCFYMLSLTLEDFEEIRDEV